VKRGRNRIGAARSASAAAFAAFLAAGVARADTCEPWPGEPAPLPALSDPDPIRAEWASLRVRELAQWAVRAERDDPLRSRQMWRRVLCIDPANDAALTGVLRARVVTVHRPELLDEPDASVGAADAWTALDAPIGLAIDTRSAAREARSQREFRSLRSAVSVLERQVRGAQFEKALAEVPALRAQLARAPRSGTRTSLIAQTEVLAATAEIALGRSDAARTSLRRALDADPGLALDASTTAPKVLRALAAARGESTP
jgi:hypothetical protein